MEGKGGNAALIMGAAMLGALLLAFFLAFAPRAAWFGGAQELRVALSDATGLRVGSEVRLRGVSAGFVSALSRLDGQALATLRFRRKPDLRADAKAWSRPKTPLGGRYIAVEPGTSAAPWPADEVLRGEPKAPEPQDLAQALAPYETMEGQALLRELETSREVYGPLLTRLGPLYEHARELQTALGALDETPRRLASLRTRLEGLARNGREAPELGPRLLSLSERVEEFSQTLGQAKLPPELGLRFARLVEAGRALGERAAGQEALLAHLEAALATLSLYDELMLRRIFQEEGVKAASGMPETARRRLLGPASGK